MTHFAIHVVAPERFEGFFQAEKLTKSHHVDQVIFTQLINHMDKPVGLKYQTR